MTTDKGTAERDQGVEVNPVAGHIGADITGVDLADDL
ncbi:TauD/TfdA family dioxygenase, partial [Streptomyces griseorubiginosus]